MASTLLVFLVLLSTVCASSIVVCPRNNLRTGERNVTRGDRLLAELSLELRYHDLVLWRVADEATTYITGVNVSDNVGLGMTATPYLHLGGPNHGAVSIRFEFRNPMQIVSITLQIWGRTTEPNRVPNEQLDQGFVQLFERAHVEGIAVDNGFVIMVL